MSTVSKKTPPDLPIPSSPAECPMWDYGSVTHDSITSFHSRYAASDAAHDELHWYTTKTAFVSVRY